MYVNKCFNCLVILECSVPEIGEDLPGKYPLLKEDKSPEFNTITIEKCVAVIGRQTLEFEDEIKTLGRKIESNFILMFAISFPFVAYNITCS